MRTLQLKVALILIGSIVAVVCVATLATYAVLTSGDASRMVGPMAQHIAFSAEMLSSGDRPPGPPLRPREEIRSAAASGTIRNDLTAALVEALKTEESTGAVIVTDDGKGSDPVASYQLPDGRWAIFAFPRPRPPPPQLWLALSSGLVLMIVGVVTVALVMARRVTRPFVVLETAVASVGADGILPHVPETGSGEVRHTAAALNRLSDRLKASMESRMRLVAAAGHDLRTPMTRMRLRAEFLPDEERAGWLADLDELNGIADSAIRLVREEGAGEDQEDVMLDRLVGETVRELKEAGLSITVGSLDPATVKAGPLALKRALRNLCANAATHGGGAHVTLKTSGGFAQVVVEDDGPGIPPELLSRVFEPFFRVDPARGQEVRGAGLGLAIAKEIIERFGGSIQLENRHEGGLRQIVTLGQVSPEV